MREVVGRWDGHGVAGSTAMTLWLLFVVRACLMDLASWRCAEREGDDEAGIFGLAGGVAWLARVYTCTSCVGFLALEGGAYTGKPERLMMILTKATMPQAS